jgi:GNAT superfamily N-acetyltransferase
MQDDEGAARDRMRELATAGDYAGALAEYARLELVLPVPPSRETRRLLERIRREAPPPLGTGLELAELDGDHSPAEAAQLTGGEHDAFGNDDLGLTWADHERRVVLRQGARLIASAGLIIAPVEVADTRFDVVGFGDVIVHPRRRGEGLARRVMEAALECAAALGPERGLLFCRPDRAGIYRKLGFRELDDRVDVAQPDGRRTLPLDALWRPLAPEATWPEGPIHVVGYPF